jgi:hypothetical protein
MPIFEIINPSDPYTLVGSKEAAIVAVTFLGGGKYGLGGEDGNEMPFLMFMSEDEVDTYFKKVLGMPLLDWVDNNRTELIECFDSVLIGGKGERQTFEKGLELIDDESKKKAWREEWHDRKRSSMNDIGGRAQDYALQMRQKMAQGAAPCPTP